MTNTAPFSVEILPTSIWIEDGICGERYVVLQHEGMDAFDYCVFNYRYGYTDNSSTYHAAHEMAMRLGAVEPIEHRHRHVDLGNAKTFSLNQSKEQP